MAFAALDKLLFCSLLGEQSEPYQPTALPALSSCPQKLREKEQCGTEKSGPPFESEVQNGLRQEA